MVNAIKTTNHYWQQPTMTMSYYGLVIVLLLSTLCMSNALRITSWNLLSPDYAVPKKYPWCDPKFLDWDYRKNLIVDQLLSCNADIYCLQEVQMEKWDELKINFPNHFGIVQESKKRLKEKSKQKARGGKTHNDSFSTHPPVAAVLIPKENFEVVRVEARSRVLIVIVKHLDQLLYICNVHLEAGRAQGDNLTRYFQLKSLFKRLLTHFKTDNVQPSHANIVLAGDFNMLHTNPLHTFLSQGLIQKSRMVNKPGGMFRLHDAYMVHTINQFSVDRLGMTYSQGSVLDYIWTSDTMHIDDVHFYHPITKTRKPHPMPSSKHPSDHLPIGVDLDWP